VMISEMGNVRCRWYLDRKQGRLLGFDSQREEDTDECEVRLTGDVESGGRHWPKAIAVRSGGQPVATFGVTTVTVGKGVAK
ncbi:MAG: hypothetical protein VX669_00505, partial [Planctomycetota bacterium]|nr:hypothetical protein [Planctomycetota bacterium]